MKSSNIGGQAVLEGVMMRNKNRYAVAVRRADGQILIDTKEYQGIVKKWTWLTTVPFLRGVFQFIDSLILGMRSLSFSASVEEGEVSLELQEEETTKEKWIMGLTIAASVLLGVFLFMIVPFAISSLLKRRGISQGMFAAIEGGLRLLIFLAYLYCISKMKEIKRVFMYHGAEHKCINCIENGLPLTVENVRKSSKEHKRCGTSFLLYVIVISIIVHFFIQFDSTLVNFLVRLLLIPVIVSISYEVIRFVGKWDTAFVRNLSRPGMALQGLTTKEPTDAMIEVGIASVEAVFDWKAFQQEHF